MPEKYATCQCTVRFLTPAFLGGAFQQGQWRTPPFKALLRQWWRVVYAASRQYKVDVIQMRQLEDELFGNAWLEKEVNGRTESDARRSLVRLRISPWEDGARRSWDDVKPLIATHPRTEVSVNAHYYLGFGLLKRQKGGKILLEDGRSAIDSGQQARWMIAFPLSMQQEIRRVLQLVDDFGSVGGRSRNGWGSLRLSFKQPYSRFQPPTRPWQDALQLDWPHCIGADSRGPLIWSTKKSFPNWQLAMQALAQLKIEMRAEFSFHRTDGKSGPGPGHWLAYPVTGHEVKGWEQARLPNSLRFRVRPAPDNPNHLIGVIFHMPCLPPPSFEPERNVIIRVWQHVHQFLDKHPQLQRTQE